MTTLTRASGKAMIKSITMYKAFYNIVTKASDPENPGHPKTHAKYRDKMDEQFVQMYYDWMAYREEIGLETDDFNKIDVGTGHSVEKYNDLWFDEVRAAYFDSPNR